MKGLQSADKDLLVEGGAGGEDSIIKVIGSLMISLNLHLAKTENQFSEGIPPVAFLFPQAPKAKVQTMNRRSLFQPL